MGRPDSNRRDCRKRAKIAKILPDKEYIVISPLNMTDDSIAMFKSNARPILKVLKRRGDGLAIRNLLESDPDFQGIDARTAIVIKALTGIDVSANSNEAACAGN
jgi:hypothetical protein